MTARSSIAVGAGIGLLLALLVFVSWGAMDGYAPPYGPYMMRSYSYGPGMMFGYGPGPGYGTPYGGNYGNIEGPAALYGTQGTPNLSTDGVKNYFERWIATQDNPRLKIGDVKEKDLDTIEVDIVTKQENALVQRLLVNRRTGFYQPSEN